MALFEIPLSTGNQKFTVQLNKTACKIRLIYRLNHWYLDILDTAEKTLIAGLALNAGTDLLEQHQHLIKGSLFIINSNEDESQGFFDLGKKIRLYWRDPT